MFVGGTTTSQRINPISTSNTGFFALQNTAVPLGHSGKKTFSSTLNLMISQMVRNGCLRFGGHVGIQVSYKILRLEVLKDSLLLVTSPCFQKGCFEAILMKNTPRILGVKSCGDMLYAN